LETAVKQRRLQNGFKNLGHDGAELIFFNRPESGYKKERHLYFDKNPRIHIDDVSRLGTILEFEVLVKYGKTQARTLLKFLSERFGLQKSAVRAVSYSDLPLKQVNPQR